MSDILLLFFDIFQERTTTGPLTGVRRNLARNQPNASEAVRLKRSLSVAALRLERNRESDDAKPAKLP